jgi:hypothetical protein
VECFEPLPNLVVIGEMLEKSNVSPIDKSKEYGYDIRGVVLGITVTSKTIKLGSAERQATVPVNFPPERNVGWCQLRVTSLLMTWFLVRVQASWRKNCDVAQLVEQENLSWRQFPP